MCGIIGKFSSSGIDISLMKSATDTLRHRGPDAAGYYTSADECIFMGHRRLSILDVSNGANQPMYSQDKRYIIVYNGEVYNFEILKQKLPGFAWKTSGDTELILELFARFGPESFALLNGIFAFSIYDTIAEKLWFCRDQLGIKPLFIQREQGKLIFASELKAIIAASEAQDDKAAYVIQKKAVAFFLHLGYIPEPLTIYEGIEKFPAAHYGVLDIRSGKWELHRYWNAKDYYLHQPDLNESRVKKQYRELLFAAVERQMVSDVPLGTFLSGGIDSSLVTAVAATVSNRPVKTFSIGFEDPKFDESLYAQQVADHLKTDHHLFKVKFEDILALVPEFIQVYDEPFADSSAFPTMLVSRMAKEHVTVTLSGDGGDEFFQGYGMYNWAKRLENPVLRLLRKPISGLTGLMNERYERAGKVLNFPATDRIPSHIFSQEQYLFSEQELEKMLPVNTINFSELNILPVNGIAQEKQAFWDIEHYLKDDLLVKVDRASMQYSLETRVPLLDQKLIEFSLNVPLSLKVDAEYGTKSMMKKILYEMVPRNIFERPKKGFSIPMARWLSHELKPMLDQYLNKQSVDDAGMVDSQAVEKLIDQYTSGKTFLYNRVWALLVLHWWYAEHKNVITEA